MDAGQGQRAGERRGRLGWAVCRAGGVRGKSQCVYLQKLGREIEPGNYVGGLEHCCSMCQNFIFSCLFLFGWFLFLSYPSSNKD